MKKISKILSILLAVCTVFTMFTFSASAAATDINAGSSLQSATKIPSYGVDYASSLSKAAEQDWFKFTTKSNEAFYTISLKNYNIPTGSGFNFELDVILYDKNMQNLGQSYCGMNGTCNIHLKLETSTTYYILVKMGESKKDNTGNYQFTVNYKDDHTPDTMTKASSVSLNQVKIESLDGTGDNDWYKFTTVSKKADYKLNLKNYDIPTGSGFNFNLDVILYDKNMQNLGQNYCGNGGSCSVNATLDANTTYYILIKMGDYEKENTGKYEFTVKYDFTVPKPANVKITPASTTSLKVTYNKVSGASGYQVYNKTTGKYYSTTANSYTITGLKVGTAYNIYVRTVMKQGGSTYTSGWSKGITISTKPATPTNFKVTPASTTSLKVTFNKVSGATAYHVYNKTTGKIYTTTSNAYTITGLKAGTSYNIYVRAVRKTSGGTAIGGWAKGITTATKPSTPSFVAGGGKGYFVTKITKVSGASGYRITYATNNKFSNAKNLNVSALNTSIKGYKKGQTVYVKVRAYKKVGSTVIWGAYSKAKAVKIK